MSHPALLAEDTTQRIQSYLDDRRPPTPCLVIDLDTVAGNYRAVRAALPHARVYYAVKANPAPEIIALLAELGSGFDVASPGEIELCLANGARPDALSYGNPIKSAADVALAFRQGVRRFSFDSEGDLRNLARFAPGSSVACRFLVDAPAARTPFGTKFGCAPRLAVRLLREAVALGLEPALCCHVGSQQVDPGAWTAAVEQAAWIAETLASSGVELGTLNLGGGFPVSYAEPAPALDECAAAIESALDARFGADRPALAIEPGRVLVATAGLIRSTVVQVSRKSDTDRHRWVYLDIGRYTGLAETENEYIAYELSTQHRSTPDGPVVIAGPTCDGDDVLYQNTPYRLPTALRPGDHVDLLAAGAYTASYSSVSFNGFPPLATHVIGGRRPGPGSFAGTHVLAELVGVRADLLDDVEFQRSALRRALDRAGATVCEVISKRFEPHGVTVLALLSESHASVHTYPERGAVFVDVFTCGDQADPALAVRLLSRTLGAVSVNTKTVQRGRSR